MKENSQGYKMKVIVANSQDVTSPQEKVNNPCQTFSPKTKKYCGQESTHVYAGLQICTACAEQLNAGGANPPPTKFNF
ncbi:MAG: hypothetical protein WAZ64_03140 [Candidatus Moraniibacteriota bacterium]